MVLAGLGALLLVAGVALWMLRGHRDAASLIAPMLALQLLLPSALVIAPAGAVGRPALLLALGLMAVWVAAKVMPASGLDRGPQPMRWGLLVYGGVMLLSYGAGWLRPLTPLEISGATRAVITLVGLLGIGLLAADGLTTRARLDRLLRTLVVLSAIMAGVGIVQFATDWNPVPLLRLPGLVANHELAGLTARSIFERPAGTAAHPIEFGVVLAGVLPVALHYALTARGRRAWRQWMMAGAIALGALVSLSRSAIVAILVGMVVLAFAWSRRRLVSMGLAAITFLAAAWAIIPGLVGTLGSLFTGASTDPSVVARQERVPKVMAYVAEHPLLGHGYGTFSIEEYLLVDNDLLVQLIQTGWIGTTVHLGLLVLGCALGIAVRCTAADPDTRHLGQALAAAIAGLLACLATFDAFGFPTFTATLFVLLGCVGALWRLRGESPARAASVPAPAPAAAEGAPAPVRLVEAQGHRSDSGR